MFGLKCFGMYLYGHYFTILTGHKPLQRIFGHHTAIPALAAQRLQRRALMLSAFDYDIQFVTSKQNPVADALSRLPLTITDSTKGIFHAEAKCLESLPVTSKEIRQATKVDPILLRVLEYLKLGWPDSVDDEQLKPFFNCKYELTVEQDCILWGL